MQQVGMIPPTHAGPTSPYALGAQAAFKDAVEIWQSMTQATKNVYNTWRIPEHASGYNRFISWYLRTTSQMPIYWNVLQRSALDSNTIEQHFAPLIPPIGSVIPYGGESAPDGWLLCNGQKVSRTTYAALFAIIGIIFGAGDGITTFGLPDLLARFPIGAEVTTDHDLGDKGGANEDNISHQHAVGTLDTANESTHTHQVTINGETIGNNPLGPALTVGKDETVASGGGSAHKHTVSGSVATGGSTTHDNRSLFLGLNYIIKF
jgi:microcystin-dependent protein